MAIKNRISILLIPSAILCFCCSALPQTNYFKSEEFSHQTNIPYNQGTVNINYHSIGKSEDYKALKEHLGKIRTEIEEKRKDCIVFEEIASVERLTNCRKRLYDLNIEQDSVEKILKRQEEDVLNWAKFIEENRGVLDPKILTKAENLFRDGQFNELKLLLYDKKLIETGDALLNKKLQNSTDLQMIVSGFLFKAKAYALDIANPFRIDSATFYYRLSLHYSDNSDSPLFEYANFLNLYGKIDSSLKYFTLYLNKYYYITKDSSKILKAQKIIGDILLEQSKYDSAVIYYISAIKFIESNNLNNKEELATLNLHLGIAYYFKMLKFDNIIFNQFTNLNFLNTKIAFCKAKDCFEELIDNCKCGSFRYEISQTLFYLGVLYFYASQNELNPNKEYEALAEKYFMEALVKLKQGSYLGTRLEAQIKVNLGDVYYAKNELLNAKGMYLEALHFYAFWELWSPTVTGYIVLYQLGKVYCDYKEFTESEQYFIKSIEKLGVKDSVKYEILRVRAITEFLEMYKSWIASIENQSDKINIQKKCCILYEKLFRKYPEHELIKDEYLNALDDLSRMYIITGQFLESQASSEKILLVEPTKNWARVTLGNSYLLRKEWDKAKIIYEEFINKEPERSMAKKELRKSLKYFDSIGITSPEIEKAKAWLNN